MTLGYERAVAQNLADIARDHPSWEDAAVIAQHQFEVFPAPAPAESVDHG
ncbi:hypothetical protein [Microbacterium sp. Root180]|nr:hypothetical protein [Microbacterium sp. Root180]